MNCLLKENSCYWYGGGASVCTLYCSTVISNQGALGGGALWSELHSCALTGNSASCGAGAAESSLTNCTLTGNVAIGGGAGDWGGSTGGAFRSTLDNCIVYFNQNASGDSNYDSGSVLNYCYTAPLPANGVGNRAADPQLASLSHLSANSPCRGAGSTAGITGTDIDGEPWANPPSIGCDECHPGTVTGPLTVSLQANYTRVAVGYPVRFTASIEGRTTESVWSFDDGVVAINKPVITHVWTEPGEYRVALWVFNDSHWEGVSAFLTVIVDQRTRYVAAGNPNPIYPYSSWATAATNIQDAVDASAVGGLVLVTNGTYASGGRPSIGYLTNRVAVEKPLSLLSVNGPEFTVIQGFQVPGTTNGYNAIRCIYLADGAVLSGFTLTNGATLRDDDLGQVEVDRRGGGVWGEASAVVSNCLVLGNSAVYGGGASGGSLWHCTLAGNSAGYSGGGAYGGSLCNCTLVGNSAGGGGGASSAVLNNCTLTRNSADYGGGAIDVRDEDGAIGTLINCTLTGNSARISGGGAYSSTLYNCIVYFNTASEDANYDRAGRFCSWLDSCCTTPLPIGGVGNITNAPLYVDQVGGNLRLQPDSPCINSGNNAYVTTAADLDGNPRIVSGTVDIGAYEYQGTGSVISYAWLQQYGLPMDGSADYADPDHEGINNWQEWRCLTCPTNAQSALRLLPPVLTRTNTTVAWESVAGVSYFLERSTNLASPFTLLGTDIVGQASTTSYTDTNAVGTGPAFYRVSVNYP